MRLFLLFSFLVASAFAQEALNLTVLTAKDTDGMETYNQRLALVNDSIAAYNAKRSAVQSTVISSLPKQEPKGEFEKQADYDARMANYDKLVYERTQAETKSISARLGELEKAKSKIEENIASMYGSVEIKSNPSGASVQINSVNAGITPFEAKKLAPGSVTIRITKDGYSPYETVLQASVGSKLKLNVVLEEKSIFSQADEIDFTKILAKDTDIAGYQSRIQTVRNRKTQISGEVTFMVNEVKAVPLKPKDEFEKQADFDARKKSYDKDKKAKLDNLKNKYDEYTGKLNRTIEVLNDYIITEQAAVKSEAALGATIELGAYDADKESFELKVQDTSNPGLPFEFKGKVGIPIDTAKVMNRSTEGFTATVSYINYPFGQANLGLKELSLTRKKVPLKVEGSFVELNDFTSQAGYAEWKTHKDSILTGKIKPKGLTVNYVMDKSAVAKISETSSEGGLGWRGWTRIIAFTAGVGFGVLAVLNNSDANESIDKYNKLSKQPPFNPNTVDAQTLTASQKDEYTKWYNQLKSYKEDTENSQTNRNIFGVISGVGFAVGIVTFAF